MRYGVIWLTRGVRSSVWSGFEPSHGTARVKVSISLPTTEILATGAKEIKVDYTLPTMEIIKIYEGSIGLAIFFIVLEHPVHSLADLNSVWQSS